MAVRKITIRRGTASAWTSANPTLSGGEMGYETDTGKMKIGTGTTAWTSLGYFAGEGGGATNLDDLDDVNTFGKLEGDVLQWNGSSWTRTNKLEILTLTMLDDYNNPVFGPPANGTVLTYNTSNNKWEPKQPTGGVASSSTPHPFAFLG